MTIRLLGAGDEALLETFLSRHADSSMFLRSNLRRGGIAYAGRTFQANYLGALDGDALVGVIAHHWNGVVIVQAPDHAAELARALPDFDARPIAGFIGLADQVATIRSVLAPHTAPIKDSPEALFSLDLEHLIVPAALTAGAVTARKAGERDLDLLTDWRHDYNVEALGAEPGEALRAHSRNDFIGRLDDTWLLESTGSPVAYQSFNATLPDMVQVGGVWTPPALRGRGYARAVVAGALRDARDRGVRRAILFTGIDNLAAQRAYRALGFTRVGDFALVLYRLPE